MSDLSKYILKVVETKKDDATHLLALIKQLLKEKQYDGVALLFTSSKEAERNLQFLPKIAMHLYHEVCLVNLTEEINKNDPDLYACSEELLKLVATHATPEILQIELLELVEDNKSEHVFTSALKAMQIVLLRQGDDKPRALEWCLNSVYIGLTSFSMPDILIEGYDEKQRRLLEQYDEIQAILMRYITVSFFYEPLIDACTLPRPYNNIFRPVGITRRNLLCCFLIEIMGTPLSLLDLIDDETKQSNTYSLQCAKAITRGITKCISDPIYLLQFVESKVRFNRKMDEDMDLNNRASCNIFLIEEKLPLDCLAIYYYMVLFVRVDAERIPLVYHPLYIMESCLYLCHKLLTCEQPPLHEKALLLMQRVLQNSKQHLIPISSLELPIHRSICLALCNLIGYSPHIHIRQLGLTVLRQYILSFEDEGKYLVIKNVLHTITHHGITGYLVILYKDLVAAALEKPDPLPSCFCGSDFRYLFLKYICQLPNGVETDLLENHDKIVSTLNAVRYFALKDVQNRTGFWDFALDLENTYLLTLRNALDYSTAHFKAEMHNVLTGQRDSQMQNLNLLNIDVANDKKSKIDLHIDPQKKLNILNQNLCLFDLMRSLLFRLSECLQTASESISKSKMSKP